MVRKMIRSARRTARLSLAVAGIFAVINLIAARAQADDCPAHDSSVLLASPAFARQLPEPLRARIAQGPARAIADHHLDPLLSPVPPDQFWWDGFRLPILNGPVHASIVFEGALIIAGEFTI